MWFRCKNDHKRKSKIKNRYVLGNIMSNMSFYMWIWRSLKSAFKKFIVKSIVYSKTFNILWPTYYFMYKIKLNKCLIPLSSLNPIHTFVFPLSTHTYLLFFTKSKHGIFRWTLKGQVPYKTSDNDTYKH